MMGRVGIRPEVLHDPPEGTGRAGINGGSGITTRGPVRGWHGQKKKRGRRQHDERSLIRFPARGSRTRGTPGCFRCAADCPRSPCLRLTGHFEKNLDSALAAVRAFQPAVQLIEREHGASGPHQGRHVEPNRHVALNRDPLVAAVVVRAAPQAPRADAPAELPGSPRLWMGGDCVFAKHGRIVEVALP